MPEPRDGDGPTDEGESLLASLTLEGICKVCLILLLIEVFGAGAVSSLVVA